MEKWNAILSMSLIWIVYNDSVGPTGGQTSGQRTKSYLLTAPLDFVSPGESHSGPHSACLPAFLPASQPFVRSTQCVSIFKLPSVQGLGSSLCPACHHAKILKQQQRLKQSIRHSLATGEDRYLPLVVSTTQPFSVYKQRWWWGGKKIFGRERERERE